MQTREHLHHLVDTLPESELAAAARFLTYLRDVSTQPDKCAPAASLTNESAATPDAAARPLRIADLGWTQRQAAETRARLATFEEDWDAPGMEGYDDL